MTARPFGYDNDFLVRVVLPWLAGRPQLAGGAARLSQALEAADRRRRRAAAELAAEIPEVLVLGLTTACNLRCPSCVVREQTAGPAASLPRSTVERLLAECRDLGIGRIALVGGEPFLADGVDELVATHEDLFFAVFTNGRAADEGRLRRWSGLANCAFFVNVSATSRPGGAESLDEEALGALDRMRRADLLFGFSATVHRGNAAPFAGAGVPDALVDRGARFGVLFDYLPAIGRRDDPLAVPAGERRRIVAAARRFAARRGVPLMFAPEDEAVLGGCGAAGRMLIHVGPQGTIDPCPFVPFSPFDAGRHTLRDALGSAFFRELRRRSRDWDRRGSGCAYRLAEREFLEVAGGYGVGVRPPIGVVTPLSRAKAIASS